ncbi:ribonuclease Z [Nematocida displodere]|uniref:ribonuclease Z n=1 Tax=Nematocida displodere TaxID=1805483 RepID=A0A177EBR5_9MICR|nr:ribonuclease Z [Nematocida displodere]
MFAIEVSTVEHGSVVRVVCKQTGYYVAIGGFEGVQRYFEKHRIKVSKMVHTVISTEWELLGYISMSLTLAMGNQPGINAWIGGARIDEAIKKTGLAIGHHEYFGTRSEGGGGVLPTTFREEEGCTICTVTLPSKRGSFLPNKAKEDGITEKKDLIALAKGGSVTVGGKVLNSADYYLAPIVYPEVAVITVVSASAAIDVRGLVAALRGKHAYVVVRAATEVFGCRKKEHSALERLQEELAHALGRTSTETRVFWVANTETEVDAISSFYQRICPIHASLVYPLIYRPPIPRGGTGALVDQSRIECASSQEEAPEPGEGLGAGLAFGLEKKEDLVGGVGPGNTETETETEMGARMGKRWVAFLGTGAALPSILRNVSSSLFFSGNGGYLLDCGEDTGTQLNKLSSGYRYHYGHINAIVLTHRHADHILGVFSVLRKINRVGNQCPIVLGNECMLPALALFGVRCVLVENTRSLKVAVRRAYKKDAVEETITIQRDGVETRIRTEKAFGSVYVKDACLDPAHYAISNERVYASTRVEAENTADEEIHFVGLDHTPLTDRGPLEGRQAYDIECCEALHIPSSYSVKVTDYDQEGAGVSVSYSGDTQPNPEFSTLSENADLMLHESTFEDCDEYHAVNTKHSTISSAIKVFEASRSKNLFLTHFSQRYKYIPPRTAFLALDYLVEDVLAPRPQAALISELKSWADKS